MSLSGRQLALPFEPTPLYAGAEFVEAPSNAAARAWLDHASEWPDGRVVVWGAPGTGKTHLLHRWCRRCAATLLPGPGLQWPRTLSGPIAVDMADEAPEEALLHLLNAAREAKIRIVLAGRGPPARWPVDLPDLASRLRAAVAVEIKDPEEALLRQLLGKLLADRQVAVPGTVQDFLLVHLPRTPAVMREAAARLDRAALSGGRRITRQLVSEIVDEMAMMCQPCEERIASSSSYR